MLPSRSSRLLSQSLRVAHGRDSGKQKQASRPPPPPHSRLPPGACASVPSPAYGVNRSQKSATTPALGFLSLAVWLVSSSYQPRARKIDTPSKTGGCPAKPFATACQQSLKSLFPRVYLPTKKGQSRLCLIQNRRQPTRPPNPPWQDLILFIASGGRLPPLSRSQRLQASLANIPSQNRGTQPLTNPAFVCLFSHPETRGIRPMPSHKTDVNPGASLTNPEVAQQAETIPAKTGDTLPTRPTSRNPRNRQTHTGLGQTCLPKPQPGAMAWTDPNQNRGPTAKPPCPSQPKQGTSRPFGKKHFAFSLPFPFPRLRKSFLRLLAPLARTPWNLPRWGKMRSFPQPPHPPGQSV